MELTSSKDHLVQLWTKNGPCEIELMSGDITKLPLEQKVSIIMVSAFPGDYAPISGTVIGALQRNLGISVRDLAVDKELDLRKFFSCWLSKPISSPDSPYKRLLCFERQRASGLTVEQAIREMFRVFVPVFNNTDNTVITPLLATGNQGYSEGQVCECMVKAAAHWIEAGLPLRCFKIVSFRGFDSSILKMFNNLKTKLLKKNAKTREMMMSKICDIYITYAVADESNSQRFIGLMQQQKPDIKVQTGVREFKKDKLWQDNIFKLMVSARRIIALLSPAFLESPECLDQYNLALCCNRLMGYDALIPLYLATISNLPSYMGLTQWIDCRVRKEGETTEGKLQTSCLAIIQGMEDSLNQTATQQENLGRTEEDDKFKYDVFISYSHKNPSQAETLLNVFKEMDPDVKVFFDRSALTTGSNWQNMLYQCLGKCRCVVALLSPTYVSSVVCGEEYNLAMARHIAKHRDFCLVPVLVEEGTSIPDTWSWLKINKCDNDFKAFAGTIATEVCATLKDRNHTSSLISPVKNVFNVEKQLSDARSASTAKQYILAPEKYLKERLRRVPELELPSQLENTTSERQGVDIAISYAGDGISLVGAFCTILQKTFQGLKVCTTSEDPAARFDILEKASRIVVFVSEEFIETEGCMTELHLAMCRQRASSENIVYLIKVDKLWSGPYFLKILPYCVANRDQVWLDLKKKYVGNNSSMASSKVFIERPAMLPHTGNVVCDYRDYFAMTKAVDDVLESLLVKGEKKWAPQNLLNVISVIQEHDENYKEVLGNIFGKDSHDQETKQVEEDKRERQQPLNNPPEEVGDQKNADLELRNFSGKTNNHHEVTKEDTEKTEEEVLRSEQDSQDDKPEKTQVDSKASKGAGSDKKENHDTKTLNEKKSEEKDGASSGDAGSPEQSGNRSKSCLIL